MLMSWSPGVSRTVDGVLPRNFPSTVMSAPSGTELMTTVANSLAALGTAIGIDGAVEENFAGSMVKSPLTYAVISVPFGTVVSLPCMNRNSGAAGKNTILVATIAPVMAPT